MYDSEKGYLVLSTIKYVEAKDIKHLLQKKQYSFEKEVEIEKIKI